MDSCSMFRAFALRKKFSQGTLLRLTDYFILPGATLHLGIHHSQSPSIRRHFSRISQSILLDYMRATLLGLIDYLVLLVLPGADMLLMDWVAVGRICKGGVGIILDCRISLHLLRIREQYHLPDSIKIEYNVGF